MIAVRLSCQSYRGTFQFSAACLSAAGAEERAICTGGWRQRLAAFRRMFE